jgi:hypothetical protein
VRRQQRTCRSSARLLLLLQHLNGDRACRSRSTTAEAQRQTSLTRPVNFHRGNAGSPLTRHERLREARTSSMAGPRRSRRSSRQGCNRYRLEPPIEPKRCKEAHRIQSNDAVDDKLFGSNEARARLMKRTLFSLTASRNPSDPASSSPSMSITRSTSSDRLSSRAEAAVAMARIGPLAMRGDTIRTCQPKTSSEEEK